ncbi:MAG: GGDEF domain-containing protein [Clostridia bacterium]
MNLFLSCGLYLYNAFCGIGLGLKDIINIFTINSFLSEVSTNKIVYIIIFGVFFALLLLVVILILLLIKNKKAVKDYANETITILENIPAGIVKIRIKASLTSVGAEIDYISDNIFDIVGLEKMDTPINSLDDIKNFFFEDDFKNILTNVREQIVKNKKFAIEVPLKLFSGEPVWVRVEGKFYSSDFHKFIICTINNITEKLKIQTELADTNDRLRQLIECTETNLIEIDFKKKAIFCSPCVEQKFGKLIFCPDIYKQIVCEDDTKLYFEMRHKVLVEKQEITTNIRLKDKQNNAIWCKIIAKMIVNAKDKSYKVLCKITDIDTLVNKNLDLQAIAERDGLTKLYNKKTVEDVVTDYLNNDGKYGTHAMVVIDADNFKLINDKYGHMAGDKALKLIAETLTTHFRKTDIVGRIGGDEFIAFLKNIKDVDMVFKKCSSLITVGKLTETEQFAITISLGISLYPNNGNNYKQLFEKADGALYEAKHNGKNGCNVCD